MNGEKKKEEEKIGRRQAGALISIFAADSSVTIFGASYKSKQLAKRSQPILWITAFIPSDPAPTSISFHQELIASSG